MDTPLNAGYREVCDYVIPEWQRKIENQKIEGGNRWGIGRTAVRVQGEESGLALLAHSCVSVSCHSFWTSEFTVFSACLDTSAAVTQEGDHTGGAPFFSLQLCSALLALPHRSLSRIYSIAVTRLFGSSQYFEHSMEENISSCVWLPNHEATRLPFEPRHDSSSDRRLPAATT